MSIQQIFDSLEYFDECTNLNRVDSFDSKHGEQKDPYFMLRKYYSR